MYRFPQKSVHRLKAQVNRLAELFSVRLLGIDFQRC
jgi:hypothetical protein